MRMSSQSALESSIHTGRTPLPAGVLQGRRGWKSEFAKPYQPLGVPNLDIAPPTNILRQKNSSQKSFGAESVQHFTSVCHQ